MTSQELKKLFLEYFNQQNHQILSSASLIPENDPTVLFTTAGMHPLVPYLIGEKHPQGERLASVQKCIRTSDIDEVGDATHHTFFEMLGNWSLGNYTKTEAIEYSWEFLTKILKLNPKNLAISIFGGNQDLPTSDEVAREAWQKLGVAPERIAKLSDNWWGPAGITGPCGPDTEMFCWSGKTPAPVSFDPEDKNWVEIWNDVFMEYNKTTDKKFEPLKQKNIDTGMGLERTLAVLNGFDDNYLTELFQPLIKAIEKLAGKKYSDNLKAFRIIADHIRSAVFIMGDPRGIAPSNKDQGYVLRRLIRRAIRFAKELSIEQNFSQTLAQVVIDQYQTEYPELKTKQTFILDEINKEENKFGKTIAKGLKILQTQMEAHDVIRGQRIKIADLSDGYVPPKLSAEFLFDMFQTHGFPFEMSIEEIKKMRSNLSNFEIENLKKEFIDLSIKHQDLSRTASAGMFKGGLADDKVNTKRHHTAAHLMLQALRLVLGNHVEQRGSNINEERVRFDFTHPTKMTPEQIKQVEDIVNQQIQKKLPVTCQEMTLDEAKKYGALGVFEHKYGERIKVYTMGGFSKEICGGPHVDNTGELGHFKINKEEASSAGVRRLKATLS